MKTASLSVFLLASIALRAQDPVYTKDGALNRPTNYREWTFLSSGLGMTYGPAAGEARADNPFFDNVFVSPKAYKAFVETGKWPDKSMFVLEIRSSQSSGSINKGGRFQVDPARVEVLVKDETRFKEKWGFFQFDDSKNPAKPLPSSAACYSCHSANAAVEFTFVQFYPTLLPIARAKGTIKPGYKE